MNNKQTKINAGRVLNRYSKWKYIALILTVLIMILSALPTWYGEKASIQVTLSQFGDSLDIVAIQHLLHQEGIKVHEVRKSPTNITLVFDSEDEQAKAKQRLEQTLKGSGDISFSYVSVAPQWLRELGMNPIKLGLDLRGGVQFLLNVDVDRAFEDQRNELMDEVRSYMRQQRIRGVSLVAVEREGFRLRSSISSHLSLVATFLSNNYPTWQLDKTSESVLVQPSQQSKAEFRDQTLQQNLKIMRDRIEELGITEAMVQRQGTQSIRIELPGVQDPAQAKNVIGATATLAFHEVRSPSDEKTYGDITLKNSDGQTVVLAKRPVLTGEHIVNARAGVGEIGFSEVNISLDQAGGKAMSSFSAHHIGKPMATVYREYTTDLDGNTQLVERVISVATIQSQLGNKFRITGAGTMQEAQELALLLRAGSLTAPVTIVEERTIGASLGAENIQNGFSALALGLGLTLVFMGLWYRRLGWVANIALMVNVVSLLGLIALLPGAVLTLPGIAGLVLTVGMAVDTNVLIFERIKDKMAEGRSMGQSIELGFSSALSTILDANITTMITAVILYCLGNGPLQGFALTLGLGLLTSMFSGIFVSRAVINLVWGQDTRRGVRI